MLYSAVLMLDTIGNLHPESNHTLPDAAGKPLESRAPISRTETEHAPLARRSVLRLPAVAGAGGPLARRSVVCLPAVAGGGGYPQHVTSRNRRNSLKLNEVKISTRNKNQGAQSFSLTFMDASLQSKYLDTRVEIFFA